MALLQWTGWNKKKKEELPLHLRQPHVHGKTTKLTSSTLQATLTSPLKLSVLCVFLMAL